MLKIFLLVRYFPSQGPMKSFENNSVIEIANYFLSSPPSVTFVEGNINLKPNFSVQMNTDTYRKISWFVTPSARSIPQDKTCTCATRKLSFVEYWSWQPCCYWLESTASLMDHTHAKPPATQLEGLFPSPWLQLRDWTEDRDSKPESDAGNLHWNSI